ncbi:helix-turn-helix domain-containing protein [Lysinibacillus antri]|uniref:XRE family transcriptional regulator n=1 Tax=Lysinibacillus antri TaxID=2498145 RepID=A0A3S0QP64_9BACI|nr:helix-turn-helix transcriptional regulator [Lysinibacillus antri]RUL51108.1 XRE family transcriptional regulator [Lysinibacillus antri]
MDFSEYVRHTRLFYGLTQKEFAEKLGYKQTTISDVENKRKNASDRLRAALIRNYPKSPEFERFLYEIKQGGVNNGS